jgi:hypothetical protein
MKLSIIALTFALSSSSVFATEIYKCFLDGVAYKKAPVVTVVSDKNNNVTLEFTANSTSYKSILTVSVKDNSEDVNALYENAEKNVSLSFFTDEGDALGLGEGSITSPVMNGSVRCLLAQ